MLNQIFISEADFKAKTGQNRPMFVCSLCLVELKVEDGITLDCDHRFCESCIKDYISELVKSDRVDPSKLVCPSHMCKQEISDTILQAHLSEHEFDKLVKFRLRRFKVFVEYPSGCGYMAEADDDRERFFNCHNCRAVYCKDCKVRASEHHRCSKASPEDSKAESKKIISDMGGKACPKCGEGLFLEKGFYFVKCPSSTCESFFCWLCEGVLTLEEHYAHYPEGPFNSVCLGMQQADKPEDHAFECSCRSPSQWMLPCSDLICVRCLRSFVLSQVNSHGFSIERIPCPMCSSVLSQDVLYGLFGGGDQFTTALEMTLIDASHPVASCERCALPCQSYMKLSCDHILCKNCMQAKIDQVTQSRNWREAKCPVSTCDTELSSADLRGYYEERDVLHIEELRLKATQETEVSCPWCKFKNVIERDATSLSCCYCRKKCCLLCNKESSEYHDCQIQPDTQCPACGRLADRNQCKYFYCNYCATWGCRLCLGVLRDLGTHFPNASGCINQRNSSAETRPQAEEVKTTSAIINADFTCRCPTPIFITLQSCGHLACKKCFAERIQSEAQGRDLSAVMVLCPLCSDTLSSDELASLVSQEEFKDNAVLGHVPTTAQTKTEFSPTVLESLARTEADKQTKLCPKCSFSKKKFGTANIQLCSQCGTDFCWLCEQVIIHRQRKVHFDPSNSYCVGLQARVAREERTSKPSNCTCGSPVELILSCGHRSCKDCLLSSALTTSDPSQVKCLTCYAVVPQELLRSLKEEQRITTAHLRGSNPALPPNPYSKPSPCCQQPCSNPLNKLTVRCSCNKEFCWHCRIPFTLTTKQSDHFVKINGEMKCKFWLKGFR
jgi:hypothetical protein